VADHESPELVASFFTLSGAGFGEPPRNGFTERCEAAAAAGFTGIGLHADDLPRTIAAGLDLGEIQAVLRLNGLSVVEIEFLGGWALPPADSAASTPDPSPASYLKTLAGIDAVADALGGRHVSAGEFRGDAALDFDEAAGRLREVSDHLAGRDLLVAVEPFPWSAIADIATATELIRRSGATNAGLMIDVWHFFNSGAELSALQDLPGAGITAFQLNDGPRVHEDFLINARATRKLAGEGDLDVVGLIRAAKQAGFAGPYCVEVNTPEFRALPVDEAARRAADTAIEVLRSALS
jgi:sugar phosphate isomerase/epimerase